MHAKAHHMTEPSLPPAASLIAVSVAVFGPMAGPYAVIVLSALAGALWALASTPTESRLAGGLLLLRLVLTAVVLTGCGAWMLEAQYGWPAHQLLGPLAFAVGMGGDRWRALADILATIVQKRLGGAGDRT